MSEQEQTGPPPALVKAQEKPAPLSKVPVAMGERGIQLRSLDEAYRWALYVANSGMAPKSFNTAEKVLVAAQTGMEAGLTPMQSLRVLYVVNGLPTWKGTGLLALIRGRGVCRRGHEPHMYIENEPAPELPLKDWPSNVAGVVTVQRKGDKARVFRFTVGEARIAGLWLGKTEDGRPFPGWHKYPKLMLQWRAVAQMANQVFPDIALGLRLDAEMHPDPLAIEDADEAAAVAPAIAAVTDAPPVDPLLDQIAPPSKEETRQREHVQAQKVTEARAALREELLRRTQGDEAAFNDLVKELTAGQGLDSLADAASIRGVAEALEKHAVFGSD